MYLRPWMEYQQQPEEGKIKQRTEKKRQSSEIIEKKNS